MATCTADDPVMIEDDKEEDKWSHSGPQNMEEARAYQDQLNKVLEDFSALLEEDRKDALHVMVQSWKWIMSRAWSVMAQANVNVVMKSIADPACITLKQTLNPGGVEVVDPPEDVPTRNEIMRCLPDKKHKQEVQECIMGVFDNLFLHEFGSSQHVIAGQNHG